MKSKLLFFLNFFLLLSIFLSCKKNDNPTSVLGKVKKVSYTTTSSTGIDTGYTECTYNTNGNLNQVISDGQTGYIKSLYTYSSNKIIVSTFNNLNVVIIHYELLLSPNGLVDSSYSYSVPPGDVESTKFSYNSNNELIQEKVYSYPYGGIPSNPHNIINFTYSNGNLITASHSTGLNYTYTYYSTISNLTPEVFGLPYKLNQSINLLKSCQFLDLTSPGTIRTYNYTYTFDSNNRVSTQTVKYLLNGTLVKETITTYTYY